MKNTNSTCAYLWRSFSIFFPFLRLCMVSILLLQGLGWPGSSLVPTANAASTLLSTSDISCAGVFLTPGVETSAVTGFPVAFRYEADGKRHYFIYDGHGQILEFPEPPLSPCNTPLASINRASLENWGGNWGTFPFGAGDNSVPGQGTFKVFGLFYDNALSQLIANWTNTYATAGNHNTFAGVTLNDATHTMNTAGCWGINGQLMGTVGSGVLSIPDSFVSAHLSPGARYGIGFGGTVVSYTGGVSLGPTLTAIAPGSPNACPPNTDTFIGAGRFLSFYPLNSNGPTCSGIGLGCTPSPPTEPYPAKMAFKDYSLSMYQPDWDPYDGHGWFNFGTRFGIGWYDDGLKGGVVVPLLTPAGWSSTNVRANPPPTPLDASGAGTMYVDSTSTHDGFNINPGDTIWAQTCRIGIDPGCDSAANGRDFSFLRVDAVDPATGRVDYHNFEQDFGSGDHKPIIGGPVYLGCAYLHGIASCSRGTFRLQIYDPAQYAEVLAGTRQSWQVEYHEEIDFTPMLSNLGSPASGSGVYPDRNIQAMVDPAARQFMVAVHDVNSPLYTVGHAIYVFNVASAPGSPKATLTASPVSISPGGSATLSWTTTGATSVSISPGIGSVAASDTKVVSPSATTTYLLTATNSVGTVTSQVGVVVSAPQGPVCGNNICEQGETATSCPADCAPGSYSCPNGIVCDGSVVTGTPDQVVCSSDLKNWRCTSNGWQPLGTACTCGNTPTPPSITAHPQNASVSVGQSATFSVTATGATGYQWQKAASGSSTFNAISSDATTTVYTTPPTQASDDGSRYRCVITNSVGSVTSTPATLTVTPAGTGAPKLNLLVPSNGSTLIGNSVIAAYYSSGDLSSVASVKFQLDANAVVTAPSLSGTYVFNNVPTGPHTLKGYFVYANGTKIAGTDIAVSFTTQPGGMPAGTMPTPMLKLPTYIPVNGTLSVEYPGDASQVGFQWTLVPKTGTANVKGRAGVPSAASFQTTGYTANLGPHELSPGTYSVSVQAFNSSGSRSAAVTQDNVTLVSANFSGVRVFPNPWRKDRHGTMSITFDRMPMSSEVKLFTLSGHWVKTLPTSNGTSSTWDLTNDKGDKVASGIYVYVIRVGDSGEKLTGQVHVIK